MQYKLGTGRAKAEAPPARGWCCRVAPGPPCTAAARTQIARDEPLTKCRREAEHAIIARRSVSGGRPSAHAGDLVHEGVDDLLPVQLHAGSVLVLQRKLRAAHHDW